MLPDLFASRLGASVALLLALAACGTKPDGTPYGVNPDKHPDGYHFSDSTRRHGYGPGTGMPKGAEMNAVTSGARADTPAEQPPADMPPQ